MRLPPLPDERLSWVAADVTHFRTNLGRNALAADCSSLRLWCAPVLVY